MWSVVGTVRRTAMSTVNKGFPVRNLLGGYRKKSYIPLSTYIWTFKGCGYVDVNVAIHKRMPHKLHRGRTGYIWNITQRAIGVEINKQFQMVGHKQWGFAFTRALHGIVASKPYICGDATGDDVQVPIHAASHLKTGDGLVTLPRQDIDVHKACSSLFSSILSPSKSIVFNPLLRNLYQSGKPRETILLYQRIRHAGGRLDQFSFPPILKAVSKVSALFEGMEIHGVALKIATLSDPYVETALMDMYATCGRIMCARKVFDKMSQRDVITWNTMIERYCRGGLLDEAFKLFEDMKGSNVMPDEMILCNIVSACGRTGNMNYNRAIYDFLKENDVRMDAHLLTALVTMYARAGSMDMAMEFFKKMSVRNVFVSTAMVSGFSKSGRLEDARLIFDQMKKRDLVCWTTMISAYAESDHPQEALRIFEKMHCSGIKPDEITMGCVISACAKLGTLDKAKWVHRYTQLNGLESELHINNSLINMYAKCGGLDAAKEVFENMPTRNVVSWSSMINAFSMHGEATDALMLFTRMKQQNVQPNEVTFIGVLYGCSHSGLVEEGKKIFASMVDEYNITPKLEHYGCMVDLYGRANRLREALEVIESMPMVPNVVIWGSLMSACRVHGELELGEFAAKKILEQEHDHDGAFVFMSNIYAKEQRWDDARNIRRVMDQKNVFKEKGFSRIDINRKEQET